MLFGLFGLAVLGAGWALATLGNVIATQTGLGSGFVGATLLAAATSLPEISTTTTAVREGNVSMAFSNVFGSNSFDLLLLFPVSILAVQTFGSGLPASSIFMAALSAVLTSVYLWSLLEHKDRAVARTGVGSLLVLILYFAGMGVFYGLT